MQKHILSVVVQNNPGLLSRVASLFGRLGFNIDSITASVTTDPKVSRITIVVRGDISILDQIIKQISKLEETLSVTHLSEIDAYCREIVFVKIQESDENLREQAQYLAEAYGAKVVFSNKNIIMIELMEVPSRIDAFLSRISKFNVIEDCRSGVTAMLYEKTPF